MDSLNNSFEQLQKNMRVDRHQHDGMSEESTDDLPMNSSESNDHFTSDNLNDDDKGLI